MLNVNDMAKGHEFYRVTGINVSPDNKTLAFGVDTVSRRKYTIYFKDLATGELLPDKIPVTSGRATWANDNKTVFYTVKDETTLRSYKIMRHVLGTDVSEDKEIYQEKDVTFGTYVFKTKSKKFIIIASSQTLSTEYRFLDASQPMGQFKIIQPRERNLEYSVDHYKDKFYIRTNYKAKNFRLMETSIQKTTKENWKVVIPHRDDVMLEGFEIFKDLLVVSERIKGLPNIRIIKWEDRSEHYLDFGEETYSAGISTNPEFETDLVRYRYTSFTTPSSVFDYNMNTKEKQLLKQQEVVGDFDPNNYQAERLYSSAKDGTKIPISFQEGKPAESTL